MGEEGNPKPRETVGRVKQGEKRRATSDQMEKSNETEGAERRR